MAQTVGSPAGTCGKSTVMIPVLTLIAVATALIVALITCVQVFYLESMRIVARELPSLQFFKETLEAKIGLSTERGALTFSIAKHVGLTVMGCLTLAITVQDGASLAQAL